MDNAKTRGRPSGNSPLRMIGGRGKRIGCAKLRDVADEGVPGGTSRTDAAKGDKAGGRLTRHPDEGDEARRASARPAPAHLTRFDRHSTVQYGDSINDISKYIDGI